jgi:uncharacterized protein YdeI (YjbR/CyaY-like superfamily)
MSPLFFKDQAELRQWFEENYRKETEVCIGYYKKGSGKPSITWSESVDEALCFGWIDGVRKSIDEESYCIRFTPRKPKSTWSRVNIDKAQELLKRGLMKPEGIEAFSRREEKNSGIYAYEKGSGSLSPDQEKAFKSNKNAWDFFQSQPPYYRKTAINWINSAKQESTRRHRFLTLIEDSEKKLKIKPLRYGKGRNDE